MDCKEIKVMLNALVDGEITDSDREIIMSHIAECEDCKKEYEELLAIKDAFGDLGSALPEGKLAESTMKEIYKKVYPEKKKSFIFRHIGTVAALFIIAIFCIYTMNSNTKDAVKEEAKADRPIKSMLAEGNHSFKGNSTAPDEKTEAADNVTVDIQTPAESLPESETAIGETIEEPKTEEPKSEESEPDIPTPEKPKSESSINEEPKCEEPSIEEEPKAETPVYVKPGYATTEFFNDFRFSNSIEFDTSIIFVNSDIKTLLTIFDTAKTVANNGIKLEIHPVKVMDILYSNSIEITSSDLPENSPETIIYTE